MKAGEGEAAVCAHDWQPIAGWYARYRCAVCRAVGYKPGAVHPQHARNMAIVPYRCEATCGGKRCGQPAVDSRRGKHFRCAAHVRPGRTAEARKALAAEVVSATHQVLTASHEVLTSGQEVLTASHEVLTGGQEVLTASHEVLTGDHEVSTAGHEVSTRGHQVSCGGHEVTTKGSQ